jgi:hypothetical protein
MHIDRANFLKILGGDMSQTYLEAPLVLHHNIEDQMGRMSSLIPSMALSAQRDNDALLAMWSTFLSIHGGKQPVKRFEMTVVDFVSNKFVPEHVMLKEASGRIHYQAILRHVLTPEEVDYAFGVIPKHHRKLHDPVPGWPYLSAIRLCDMQPGDVHRLTSAALLNGYSRQTVKHIRNVVSAIFSHAKRELCFIGENPVKSVKLPEAESRHSRALTPEQMKLALRAMEYPEKEMAVLAALTDMTPAEISGLQWKQVNLTAVSVDLQGVLLPPNSIAITQQWVLGKLESVKENRLRILPIPGPLGKLLSTLAGRPRFAGLDDFVLGSRTGAPVNQKDIVARRLRPIAKRLGLPSLSMRTFRSTSKALLFATWANI